MSAENTVENTVTRFKQSVETKLVGNGPIAGPLKKLYRTLAPSRQMLRASLERPVSGECVPNILQVRGWAFTPSERAISGSILVNHRVVVPISFSVERPEVIELFGSPGNSPRVGFDHALNWDQVCPGLDEVEVSISLNNGAQHMMIGPVRVRKAGVPERKLRTLQCCLESPLPQQEAAEKFDVRGWVVAFDQKPLSGNVIVDGKAIQPLVIGQIRPDVALAFGLPREESRVGFHQTLYWKDLAVSATDSASVVIEIAHGNEVSMLGPVAVKRTTSSVLLHQRGNYKEVWDKASGNHNDAMLAVAGTADFSAFMESGESTARTVRETIGITPSDTVLEIGCGTGRIGAALAPDCHTWIGADISGKMLDFARQNLRLRSNVKLVELKACGLSEFDSESIDKLYCSVVFMHLDEWDRFYYVLEAMRVLKPGGVCYFDNLNLTGEEGWRVFAQMASIDPAQRPAQISKISTGEELQTYLQQAGFLDIKVRREPLLVTAWGRKPQ